MCKRKSLLRLAAACSGVLAGLPAAMSATLAEASGRVLVDLGQGFRPASLGQQLPTGARVMAQAGGQARVSYPDFCVSVVNPGGVYVVRAQSPCQAGAPGVPGELLAHDWAIGGAAAVAAGVGIYAATRDKSDKPDVGKPASP